MSTKEATADLLTQESRQINRQYANNKLSPSSSQQSVDYYDYYDYAPVVSNTPAVGKLSAGNNLAGNGLANRKAFQQRQGQGQLNRLGGLSAASSGIGAYSGNHASYSGGEEYCDNGISIALLLTALLGIAVMFYVLYTKITKGRRRRRSTEELDTLEENMNPVWFAMEHFQDYVYSGMSKYFLFSSSYSSGCFFTQMWI